MARFHGNVGFAVQELLRPGVWQDVITERPYSGNVIKDAVRHEGDKVNQDVTISTSISIVADPYLYQTFHAMKYIWWMGTRWLISNTEPDPDRPRLILRLGGVYIGPDAVPVSSPSEAP